MIKEFIQADGKRLQLTEHAINHVLTGDFVIRTMNSQDNMTVLSGGLHTYDAWVNFKKYYNNKVEHLHFYNSTVHDFWYYARELGNGVITLRLPKELFSGKAAKITMYPDDYYKSGYLWKTLFPKGYDREKLISIVEEALSNEDINQRQPGQIVGYINNENSILKMKVSILHRGKEIKSFFPTWTQPNTTVAGKPFSHYENIGFVIAQSTEYFDDSSKKQLYGTFNFTGEPITPRDLHLYTPNLFISRVNPEPGQSVLEWNQARRHELSLCELSEQDNDIIYNYLNDFSLIKNYPELLTGAYNNIYDLISSDSVFYNTFQIVQNFIDGLYYLYINARYEQLIETIEYILANMVSHTLFDLMSKKRILSTILNIVTLANIPELSYKFIVALAKSPIRREAYVEYNIDSLCKKKLKIDLPYDEFPDDLLFVTLPNRDMKIEYCDFIEILKEALGETYTLTYREEDLDLLLGNVISRQSPYFRELVQDSLTFFSLEDFTSLSSNISVILQQASNYTEGNIEILSTSVGLILRDYCRIQFAHRQRVNARYIEYHEYANTIYLPVDMNLLFGMILKHERWTNTQKLESFIQGIIDFSDRINNHSLKNDAENFKKNIGKERPPLPERSLINSI